MTPDELRKLAEKAEKDGDLTTASVLFSLLGSKLAGIDSEFSHYCASFSREFIRQLEYKEWLESAGK